MSFYYNYYNYYIDIIKLSISLTHSQCYYDGETDGQELFPSLNANSNHHTHNKCDIKLKVLQLENGLNIKTTFMLKHSGLAWIAIEVDTHGFRF